jgi:hypothetical protein
MARDDDNSISVKTAIQSLSMKTIEAFSMGQISESQEHCRVIYSFREWPLLLILPGSLVFNDVFVKPAVLNNRLHLRNETIQFKPGGIFLVRLHFPIQVRIKQPSMVLFR